MKLGRVIPIVRSPIEMLWVNLIVGGMEKIEGSLKRGALKNPEISGIMKSKYLSMRKNVSQQLVE